MDASRPRGGVAPAGGSDASSASRPPTTLGPNYRRLWSSSAASNLADGIFFVTLPLIAVGLTTSPVLIAGVAVAARLPWLVFVLVAGALADRLDRRVTMRNVQLMRVAVVGLLVILAASGQLSLPLIYVAAFVLGIGETLFDTAAQSLMPSLVPRELLNRANSRLYAVELIMNTLIGPPLGGLLVAISVPIALAGSVLGYAIAAVGLAFIVGSFRALQDGPRRSMRREIREGFTYLWGNHVLRTLAIMVAAANVANAAVMAVFVLFVVAPGPMGLDEVGFGLLMSTFAIGGVLGSLLVERVEARVGRSDILFAVVIAGGLLTMIPALTAAVVPVAAGMIALGAAIMMWNVITVSLRQRIVPDHLLGRLNATYRLFAFGSMPIGAILGGLLAEVLGLPAVFIVAGLISLSMLWFRRTLTDAALDAAERAPAEPATDGA